MTKFTHAEIWNTFSKYQRIDTNHREGTTNCYVCNKELLRNRHNESISFSDRVLGYKLNNEWKIASVIPSPMYRDEIQNYRIVCHECNIQGYTLDVAKRKGLFRSWACVEVIEDEKRASDVFFHVK